MIKKSLLILLCTSLFSACATSPTGRSQFIFMSSNEMNRMGIQAFDDLKKQTPISTNSNYTQFVTCIANAITREVGGTWEVVVFEDPTLNAFALPGKKIGVHTGLIKMVDNQDQLAAVIGHEVGHVLAKHSNERMSQQVAVEQGIGMVQAISSPQSSLGQMGIGMLGVGAQYGVILPFSRLHESEADIIGLDLMAKAGFNPEESVVLWQKMDQASQGRNPAEFLSTHPSHGTRIQELKQHMPAAIRLNHQALAQGKHPNCTK